MVHLETGTSWIWEGCVIILVCKITAAGLWIVFLLNQCWIIQTVHVVFFFGTFACRNERIHIFEYLLYFAISNLFTSFIHFHHSFRHVFRESVRILHQNQLAAKGLAARLGRQIQVPPKAPSCNCCRGSLSGVLFVSWNLMNWWMCSTHFRYSFDLYYIYNIYIYIYIFFCSLKNLVQISDGRTFFFFCPPFFLPKKLCFFLSLPDPMPDSVGGGSCRIPAVAVFFSSASGDVFSLWPVKKATFLLNRYWNSPLKSSWGKMNRDFCLGSWRWFVTKGAD